VAKGWDKLPPIVLGLLTGCMLWWSRLYPKKKGEREKERDGESEFDKIILGGVMILSVVSHLSFGLLVVV
jgi:hypothetical protein